MPFHPAVSGWFADRFGQPTDVQRRTWAVTVRQRHALVVAPTGSGKTLAAFLSAIDDLVVDGLAHGLDDAVHVLYVSPLKALSNDIRRNLQEPLAGIRARLAALGLPDVPIRDAVRTGDTPAAERDRMRRQPPHILVTTPESLFILLTSPSGRAMMRRVRTVIVDELHAVAGGKRGAHLALSLERLETLTAHAPVRIGLSATVTPLDEMARFLVGARADAEPVDIVDAGHARDRDLALEVPRSPLSAVMATEVWDEVYDRLADLAGAHRTTLVFVNQRRIAERVARHLADRLGEAHVAAHHGSLAREHRLQAEQRLKAGELRALVATSSLELGIDIGDVDLVCQIGSPRGVNAFLQRVGRSGHAVGAVPKGRLFPTTLDDLIECAALLDAVARGELDRVEVPRAPLDALAQQVVAEVACAEWPIDDLYACLTRAHPYRALPRERFEQVVRMLGEGYSTRRGRRGAYLHLDAVHRILRPRRGAGLAAVTNAGVIPDSFDYDVVLQPEGQRVGTLNEDFAFESLPGDVFQLGNTAYRIAKVETGKVLVEDAHGQPPTLPFWLGESPGRSDALSRAVSRLVEEVERCLDDAAEPAEGAARAERWLVDARRLPPPAAQQLARTLAAAKAALGALPTQRRIVFERFFDEVGDMHLVIHSPWGSRLNKAWGLALRKRMCRAFDFELQASALEDSIVLSLGPSHSFPLADATRFLHSATAHDVLVQALLDAPMFGTRWRWNATAALAVRRSHGSRKVPPQFQRSDAQDLLTVVFPAQQACAENVVGEREIPDHPLVAQTLDDCLHESMDADGFVALLRRIEAGEVEVVARDLATPSVLSYAILNARPYAFLDGGAAEERRTKAVATRPLEDIDLVADLGRIEAEAVAAVCEEVRPAPGDAEELHDALVTHAFLVAGEVEVPDGAMAALVQARRATVLDVPGAAPVWVAAERLHELRALRPGAGEAPPLAALGAPVPRADALREVLRSRLEWIGPVAAEALARPLALPVAEVEAALHALEAEGAAMRGAYTGAAVQWCDRRLLARMARRQREARRARVQPVPPAQLMRFLLRWQGLAGEPGERRGGDAGLLATLRQLEGIAAPAGAWEDDLLAARVADYAPAMLDRLCASGRVAWWRPPVAERPAEDAPRRGAPVRGTPVVIAEREAMAHWRGRSDAADATPALSGAAQAVRDALAAHGASFVVDLRHDTGLLGVQVEAALGELVAHGLVTCDSFAGLRALVMPADTRDKLRRRRPGHEPIDEAGRWSLARAPRAVPAAPGSLADPAVEHVARVLLRRWGVVFRRLLDREDGLPPWRELHYVYRRLEARGEVQGGRFVSGFAGEQFALPEAVAALRKAVPGTVPTRVAVAAVDPLNLAGLVTPGERVARVSGNRLLYEDGVPVATLAGGAVRFAHPLAPAAQWEATQSLVRRARAGPVEGVPRPA